MALFFTTVFIGLFIVGIMDCVFMTKVFDVSAGVFVVAILASAVLAVVIDAFFAILMNKLPNKWFGKDNKAYVVSKKEQKFYEKIGIRRWKDSVWELGSLGGFSKSKVENPNSPEYIERFLIESNKGVAVHFWSMVFGFGIIFLFPKLVWVVGVPVGIINLFLNSLSLMILRYNTPKLQVLYKRASRSKQQETKSE